MNGPQYQLTPPIDPFTGLPMQPGAMLEQSMMPAVSPQSAPAPQVSPPLQTPPVFQPPNLPAPKSSDQALANLNRASQIPLQNQQLVNQSTAAQNEALSVAQENSEQARQNQQLYNQEFVKGQAAVDAHAKFLQDTQTKGDQYYQQFSQELNNSYKQLDDAKIDPSRLMKGWNGILAGVSMALGELGSALTKNPNNAMKTINDAIERDIYAQKVEFDKLKEKPGRVISAYGILRQKMGDDTLTNLGAMNLALRKVDNVVANITTTTQNSQTIQRGADIRAGIAQKLVDNDTLARQRAQELAIQTNSTAASVLGAKENNAADNAAKSSNAKPMSADMVQDLAAGETALKLLDDLEASWDSKSNSKWSGVSQFLPHTDAGEFNDDRKRILFVVGKGIEGGKMTDADADRHIDSGPTNLDGRSKALNKIAGLRKLVLTAQTNRLRTAEQTGYDTSGVPISSQMRDYLIQEQKEKADAAAKQNGGQTTPQGIKVR